MRCAASGLPSCRSWRAASTSSADSVPGDLSLLPTTADPLVTNPDGNCVKDGLKAASVSSMRWRWDREWAGSLRLAKLIRTPEPQRHDVHFRRLRAARGRLDVPHCGKVSLEPLEQPSLRPALQHLADEGAALLQHLRGEG